MGLGFGLSSFGSNLIGEGWPGWCRSFLRACEVAWPWVVSDVSEKTAWVVKGRFLRVAGLYSVWG